MKSTVSVRKVDALGGIALAAGLRPTRNVNVNGSLVSYGGGSHIILKKYEPACIFCNSANDIINFKGKNVCSECAKSMSEARQG